MEQQVIYLINEQDNVATALTPLTAGTAKIRGAKEGFIQINESINVGHKIALCIIEAEAPIIKYGVCIGSATKKINQGNWVHLHVMRSNYDERSSHLNVVTGAPMDVKYE